MQGIEIVIERIIKTGVSAETRDELNAFAAQARAGTLDPMDRDYVRSLARRLGVPVIANDQPSAKADKPRVSAKAQDETETLRRELDAALAEIDRLNARIAELEGQTGQPVAAQ